MNGHRSYSLYSRFGAAWVLFVILIVVTFFAFAPLLVNDFLKWDDNTNFLNKPLLSGQWSAHSQATP